MMREVRLYRNHALVGPIRVLLKSKLCAFHTAQSIYGNPWIIVQGNPRIVQIHALRTTYMYVCYVQCSDRDIPRIVLRKPRIRALRKNPRIGHTIHGCI